MADTEDWDEPPRSEWCDRSTCDVTSLGTAAATMSRDDWRRGSAQETGALLPALLAAMG